MCRGCRWRGRDDECRTELRWFEWGTCDWGAWTLTDESRDAARGLRMEGRVTSLTNNVAMMSAGPSATARVSATRFQGFSCMLRQPPMIIWAKEDGEAGRV